MLKLTYLRHLSITHFPERANKFLWQILARRKLNEIKRQLAVNSKLAAEVSSGVSKKPLNPAALALACWVGQLGTIERLIVAGADPNEVASNGNTPLLVAIEQGHVEVRPEFGGMAAANRKHMHVVAWGSA